MREEVKIKEIHNSFIKEIASVGGSHIEHGWSWCKNCTSSKRYYASQFSAANGVVEWS
jgi:hypothetical protein